MNLLYEDIWIIRIYEEHKFIKAIALNIKFRHVIHTFTIEQF